MLHRRILSLYNIDTFDEALGHVYELIRDEPEYSPKKVYLCYHLFQLFFWTTREDPPPGLVLSFFPFPPKYRLCFSEFIHAVEYLELWPCLFVYFHFLLIDNPQGPYLLSFLKQHCIDHPEHRGAFSSLFQEFSAVDRCKNRKECPEKVNVNVQAEDIINGANFLETEVSVQAEDIVNGANFLETEVSVQAEDIVNGANFLETEVNFKAEDIVIGANFLETVLDTIPLEGTLWQKIVSVYPPDSDPPLCTHLYLFSLCIEEHILAKKCLYHVLHTLGPLVNDLGTLSEYLSFLSTPACFDLILEEQCQGTLFSQLVSSFSSSSAFQKICFKLFRSSPLHLQNQLRQYVHLHSRPASLFDCVSDLVPESTVICLFNRIIHSEDDDYDPTTHHYDEEIAKGLNEVFLLYPSFVMNHILSEVAQSNRDHLHLLVHHLARLPGLCLAGFQSLAVQHLQSTSIPRLCKDSIFTFLLFLYDHDSNPHFLCLSLLLERVITLTSSLLRTDPDTFSLFLSWIHRTFTSLSHQGEGDVRIFTNIFETLSLLLSGSESLFSQHAREFSLEILQLILPTLLPSSQSLIIRLNWKMQVFLFHSDQSFQRLFAPLFLRSFPTQSGQLVNTIHIFSLLFEYILYESDPLRIERRISQVTKHFSLCISFQKYIILCCSHILAIFSFSFSQKIIHHFLLKVTIEFSPKPYLIPFTPELEILSFLLDQCVNNILNDNFLNFFKQIGFVNVNNFSKEIFFTNVILYIKSLSHQYSKNPQNFALLILLTTTLYNTVTRYHSQINAQCYNLDHLLSFLHTLLDSFPLDCTDRNNLILCSLFEEYFLDSFQNDPFNQQLSKTLCTKMKQLICKLKK